MFVCVAGTVALGDGRSNFGEQKTCQVTRQPTLTCPTVKRPMDMANCLTFGSKFEHILTQLSLFVHNYGRELQNFRASQQTSKKPNEKSKDGAEEEEDVAKSLVEVNRTLTSIEEDLHKIIQLMMLQVELVLRQSTKTPLQDGRGDDSLVEFHHYCHDNEVKFNRQLAKLKAEMDKNVNKSSSTPKRHFQVKSNDVHFILGTNAGTSHSIVAAKQIKLSQLKQHSSLCQDRLTSSVAKSSTLDGQLSPSAMSKHIETMIKQLQMEHDLINRLLQKQVKRADERSRVRSRMLLSHMVHIMNHIYDLHQVNTRFLLDRQQL